MLLLQLQGITCINLKKLLINQLTPHGEIYLFVCCHKPLGIQARALEITKIKDCEL